MKRDLLNEKKGKTCLFSMGQAGFVVRSASGKLLGIDLYLSECVECLEGHMGFKRLLPPLFAPEDVVFDYLIATHSHLDHYDEDAMPGLMKNGKTKLFASVGCEELVRKSDIKKENVVYVRPGDCITVDDFKLSFLNCDHGAAAPDAVGVCVLVDNKNIIETGDTCLRLDRIEEYLKAGAVDVLIAPINGKYGNMSEKDCALLSEALQPKLTIPCHYGMFASHGGDPGLFYQIMTENYLSQKVLLMRLGECLVLK